jgi:membrane fusion protein, multidrug efflux system
MQQKRDAHFNDDRPIPPTAPPDKNNNDNGSSIPHYKNIKLLIPLLIIILGIAFLSWRYWVNRRDFITSDDAYIDGNRVSISAKMLGRINQLTADEGDSVRQGQILVKLDDSDLRAQKVQAQAALALAKENITLAKISMKRADSDFQRAAKQFHDNVISKEQYDHAQSELESAKARHSIAKAQMQTSNAQLGIIETQLHNTIIQSPMNGVVSKRWVLAGDVVQPGQAIFSIYDLKNIWVTVNFEETHLQMLHLDNQVSIKIDAYPRQEFSGRVMQIGSNTASQFSLIPPNNASGNFTKITQRIPVKIAIEKFDEKIRDNIRLLPGMSVEVKVRIR